MEHRVGLSFRAACVVLTLAGCAGGSGSKIITTDDPSNELDASTSDAGHKPPLDTDAGASDDPNHLPDPPAMDPNDEDGDGSRGGVDCDDHNPKVHPGAPEVCDGIDNDCDGHADNFAVNATTYYPDNDKDGLGNGKIPVPSCQMPVGWVTDGSDCDDNDPNVGNQTGEFCGPDPTPVIYVSKHGNDDNTGESPAQAVLSINKGIARAVLCAKEPCSVLIAEGTYQEAINMANDVSLFGGYTEDFLMRDEKAHEVVIQSGEPRTLSAAGITTPTRVDRVTIRGAALGSDDGASSYAVWVEDTVDALSFTNVHVVAGKGANGTPGTDGVAQSCNAQGGPGGAGYNCGASQGTAGDAGGDPVSGGGAGGGGNSYCVKACPAVGSDGISGGDDGSNGGDGGNGAGGKPASEVLGSFVDGSFVGTLGEAGQRGFHGTGGGGGGSGGSKCFAACFSCDYELLGGHGGDGAPGGCGGGGGGPGNAGGGAFAIALHNAKVTIQEAVLEGGTGGTGGTGGNGITGSAGGTLTTANRSDRESTKCGLINYHSGYGGVGGLGGKGGTGGGGAGGTGGPAITLALIGDSLATTMGNISLLVGTGGAGGQAGGGPGNAGQTGASGGVSAQQKY